MPISISARKEARELWGYVAAVVGVLFIMAWSLRGNSSGDEAVTGAAIAVVYILAHLIAVWPIASEFSHGTMARLLAQPVPRQKIWRSKFSTSGLALLGALLLALAIAVVVSRSTGPSGPGKYLAIWALAIAPVAATTGPLMAIALRQTLTATLAAMLIPFCLLITVMFAGYLLQLTIGTNPLDPEPQGRIPLPWYFLWLGFIVVSYYLARRQFLKLEV